MSNKTFIPAFRAKVGDWEYYICIMKYAEVARQVQFAHELGGNKDLGTMIQRGITSRTADITQYLLTNEHRFLGSMIVATWGGDPEYTSLRMDDPDGMMSGLDREFGVLTLDGTQSFFALDGQHRLRAIKDAIKQDPDIGREDVAVLLVPHFNDEAGRRRTRRLFTNINRNAKPTSGSENIALDEDDGFAIVTRQLLNTHPFLSKQGVVKVFVRPPSEEGGIRLAGSSIPQTDSVAWTTMSTLFEVLKNLGFGLDPSMRDDSTRPTDEALEAAAITLGDRIDELLKSCGDLKKRLNDAASARDVRAPKKTEGTGHPFMRPIVQKAVTKCIRYLVEEQKTLTWKGALQGLKELDWELNKAPWVSVFIPARGTMQTGKGFSELLDALLVVHLAPPSRQEIKRARRKYRELKGGEYPISEAALAAKLASSDA